MKKVKRTFERQAATLVLHFSNGERIETTKEHPFYVEGRGFVPAGEMGIGTSIVTRAGPSAKLVRVEVKNATATVYSFEVVLASLGQPKAAQELKRMLPPSERGMDIGELEKLARRYGAPMRGFQSKPELLASLPMALVLHYDFSSNTPAVKTSTAKASTAKASTGKAASVKTVALKAAAKTPFRVEQRAGHFVVARRVDAAKREVTLFDPQEGRVYTLSFTQLAREWSGAGLMLDRGDKGATRLTAAQKAEAVGGCCGLPSAPDDLGCDEDNDGIRDPCNTRSEGEPSVSVNRITMNMFVRDTPLWYKTPIGPDVDITMSYNSQDATTQNTAFGNKWTFNYGSYLVEDTAAGGGRVTVFMSDGRQDDYTPDGSGGYNNEVGVHNRLVKLETNSWELRFPEGDKAIYNIPQGTTSLQPFLVELRDRWGYSLRFGYDADVRLTTITDAQNKVTRLNYDSLGHIVRVWDPFGRQASFSYDQNGNMVEAIDMEGHAFQYSYDSLVRLTQLNTAQGPWQFHHEGPDGSGNGDVYPAPGDGMWASIRLTVTDPANQKEEYFYYAGWGYDTDGIVDERSWHVSKNHYVNYTPEHNNSSSNVPKTQWDTGSGASNQGELIGGKGKIRIVSTPSGEKTYTDYDPDTGQPTSITGPDGQTRRMTYNAQGQSTSITDPKGQTTTFTYAPNGLDVTSITNAQGQVVASFQYDQYHQPTQITDITGSTTETAYTAWGAPSQVTKNGKTATLSYNAQGQLAATSLNGITLSGMTYDEKGRVKTRTDAAGLTVTYEYNNLDHVTKESYPDGTSVETDYACCGLAGVVKDRAGRRSYYDYDAMKRLVRVQDANANTLQMDYDKDGNLTRLLDGKGSVTRWGYDSSNRLTRKIYADGSAQLRL